MTQKTALQTLNLETAWIYKVSVLADLVARRVSEVVRDVSDLNHSQWRVIAAIADVPGRTASDVVDVTPMDKGIVSRAVASLVERDLVERRGSASDGRRSLLFLTGKGEAQYSDIVRALSQTGADGLAALAPGDNAAFLSLLAQTMNAYGDRAPTV